MAPILRAVMHMNRLVVVQREDEWLASYRERQQIAQACRELANHTPPGEPREQLLEIAKMWEIVERSDLVRQHPELAQGAPGRGCASGGVSRPISSALSTPL